MIRVRIPFHLKALKQLDESLKAVIEKHPTSLAYALISILQDDETVNRIDQLIHELAEQVKRSKLPVSILLKAGREATLDTLEEYGEQKTDSAVYVQQDTYKQLAEVVTRVLTNPKIEIDKSLSKQDNVRLLIYLILAVYSDKVKEKLIAKLKSELRTYKPKIKPTAKSDKSIQSHKNREQTTEQSDKQPAKTIETKETKPVIQSRKHETRINSNSSSTYFDSNTKTRFERYLEQLEQIYNEQLIPNLQHYSLDELIKLLRSRFNQIDRNPRKQTITDSLYIQLFKLVPLLALEKTEDLYAIAMKESDSNQIRELVIAIRHMNGSTEDMNLSYTLPKISVIFSSHTEQNFISLPLQSGQLQFKARWYQIEVDGQRFLSYSFNTKDIIAITVYLLGLLSFAKTIVV